MNKLLEIPVAPDWEGLMKTIRREPTQRVHHIELYNDAEIDQAICERYGLSEGLDVNDPYYHIKLHVKVKRFLGYDFIRMGLEGADIQLNWHNTKDTGGRAGGRTFIDEHKGPITNWEEFEAYPWPDVDQATSGGLEWLEKNLPDDMCVIGSSGFGHFMEWVSWLMGYETLCYTLYEDRELVQAIADKVLEHNSKVLERILQFSRVKITWGSDDLGFKGGTLVKPSDLREFILPAHKKMAQMSHDAGKPYLFHSCGKLTEVYADLIDDVKIDAKHSFEDTIETVQQFQADWGNKVATLGGIDMDFLCRSNPDQVRARVRKTLDDCWSKGGYCLGSGNSVANYVPVDNYLTMLDEGRRFTA